MPNIAVAHDVRGVQTDQDGRDLDDRLSAKLAGLARPLATIVDFWIAGMSHAAVGLIGAGFRNSAGEEPAGRPRAALDPAVTVARTP